MELCLPDYAMLEFLPSMNAAAALNLAIRVYGDGDWVSICCTLCVNLCVTVIPLQTPALRHYSTYSEADIMPCLRKMCSLLVAMPTTKQQAVRKKYSDEKFLCVAKNEALQGHTIRTLAAQS